MLTWIANMCGYLAIDFPGEIWRAAFGKNVVRKWWDSHYR
jgi:hypothetical protein